MSEQKSFTTTNSSIVDFVKANPLVNFENLILQAMNDYSNQTTKIVITKDELTQIHEEYQNILHCKVFFDNLCKEIKTTNLKIKSDAIENICSKYLNIKQEVFNCVNCNKFTCSKKKGLQTHMRKCLKDNSEQNNVETNHIKLIT